MNMNKFCNGKKPVNIQCISSAFWLILNVNSLLQWTSPTLISANCYNSHVSTVPYVDDTQGSNILQDSNARC